MFKVGAIRVANVKPTNPQGISFPFGLHFNLRGEDIISQPKVRTKRCRLQLSQASASNPFSPSLWLIPNILTCLKDLEIRLKRQLWATQWLQVGNPAKLSMNLAGVFASCLGPTVSLGLGFAVGKTVYHGKLKGGMPASPATRTPTCA